MYFPNSSAKCSRRTGCTSFQNVFPNEFSNVCSKCSFTTRVPRAVVGWVAPLFKMYFQMYFKIYFQNVFSKCIFATQGPRAAVGLVAPLFKVTSVENGRQ